MPTPTIIPIDTPTLGDRSYLVHDGEVAFVVDPQRDIDRVLELAGRERVRITHVFETHIHNDYVTGGLALAELTGAGYFVNADDDVSYARTPIRDGEELAVGASMRVRVLSTPGHTFTHLSYALSADGQPVGVFTGGSLLYGTTGRPDLLGPQHTHDLVHAQYASAQRLAAELPDDAEVFPTHGFGSFCSATQSEATASTIGQERRTNTVLTETEEHYVRDLLDALDDYPAYYAHMAPANLAGPSAPDLTLPSLAQPEELRSRIEAGEWVVDLRHRTAFAAGHVPGTFNFGIDGAFATYVGWLIDWGTPITLLGRDRGRGAAGAAGAGPDRHRPPGCGRDRHAAALDHEAAGDLPAGDFRRPGPGAPPPQGGHPRRPAGGRVRRRSDRGRHQHPDPRAAAAGPRGAGRRGVGALRRRATAPRSPPRSSPPPVARLVAIDDSFDNAERPACTSSPLTAPDRGSRPA